jgi:hypothetical protein
MGIVFVQTAWILTMPAFRGSDEFDHVYQAAAVARGQWAAHDPAPNGRGGVVTIPASIVWAASQVCQFYKYVGHDNCFPIGGVKDGRAQVATAAGTYNPAYYLVVGTLARPFSGAASDFAMRAITAGLCALLIAWAAAITARWANTAWPLLTLAFGLTPVLLYSTAIAAPNGVTFASAALVWASLAGMARADPDVDEGHRLAMPLTVGSVVMVATHTTGVIWLMLALAVMLFIEPVSHWFGLAKRHVRSWLLATVSVLTATVLCVVWILIQHTNALSSTVQNRGPFPLGRLPEFHILWSLQAIAAFPLRNEPAPIPVYVIWGVVLLGTLVALFRLGNTRERVAGSIALLFLAVLPTALTMVSYKTEGIAWQGRYALPLWLGVTTLAGLVLDRRCGLSSRRSTVLILALLGTAMTISTVHVGLRETALGPADPVAAAMPAGFALVGVLTVMGYVALIAVMTSHPAQGVPAPDTREPSALGIRPS